MMSGYDSVSTYMRSQSYYRDTYRILCKVAIGLAALICVLILVQIIVVKKYVPDELYFTTTADGDLKQIYPMDQPHMDIRGLQRWAIAILPDIFSFEPGQFEDQRRRAFSYFTLEGGRNYSAILQSLKVEQSLSSGVEIKGSYDRMRPFSVVRQGVIGGTNSYYWVIRTPILLELIDPKTKEKKPFPFTLDISVVRGLDLDARDGVLIQKMESPK